MVPQFPLFQISHICVFPPCLFFLDLSLRHELCSLFCASAYKRGVLWFFYWNSATAAFRNGRCLSTDSNKVDEPLKVEEAETVDIPPPPTEKVISRMGYHLLFFFSSYRFLGCVLLLLMYGFYVLQFSCLCWVEMDLLALIFAKKL